MQSPKSLIKDDNAVLTLQTAATPAQSLPHHGFQADDALSLSTEGSFLTPSSRTLLAKFDSLEKQWTSHTPGSFIARSTFQNPLPDADAKIVFSNRNVPKEQRIHIIGCPDEFPKIGSQRGVASLASLGLTEGTDKSSKKVPVYERLYQQGKATIIAKRKQESSQGKADSTDWSQTSEMSSLLQTSVAGSTISTLSSGGGVFDRLHRNEKRPPGSIKSSRSLGAYRRKDHTDDHLSAAASLERRLSYTPSTATRRPRSTIASESSGIKPTLVGSVRKPSSAVDQPVPSNVFQRLYQNKKKVEASKSVIPGKTRDSSQKKQPLSTSKPRVSSFSQGGGHLLSSRTYQYSGIKTSSRTARNQVFESPESASVGEKETSSVNSLEAFLWSDESKLDRLRSDTDRSIVQDCSGLRQAGVDFNLEALNLSLSSKDVATDQLCCQYDQERLTTLKRNASATRIQRAFRLSISSHGPSQHPNASARLFENGNQHLQDHGLDFEDEGVEAIQLAWKQPEQPQLFNDFSFRSSPGGEQTMVTSMVTSARFAKIIQLAWRGYRAQLNTLSLIVKNWIWDCDLGSLAGNDLISHERLMLDCLEKARKRVDCWWITEGIVQRHETQVQAKWVRRVVRVEWSLLSASENCTFRLMCVARRVLFTNSWSRRKLATLLIKATLEKEIIIRKRSLATRLVQRWFRSLQSRVKERAKACVSLQKPNETAQTRDLESPTVWFESSPVADDDASAYDDAMTEECESFDVHSSSYSPLQTEGKADFIHMGANRFPLSRARRVTVATATLIHTIAQRVRSPENKHESATVVARIWRAYQARRRFRAIRRSTIAIQTFYRQQRERRRVSALFHRVIKLHDFWRSEAARRHLQFLEHVVASLQAKWKARRFLKSWTRSTVVVQSLARGYIARRRRITLASEAEKRRRLCGNAAILIQAAWMSFHTTVKYRALRYRTIAIQRMWRKYSRLLVSKSATSIQRIVRGYLARRKVRHQRVAASTIQKAWSRVLEDRRNQAQTMQSLAIVVQCFWRRSIARKQVTARRQAIILLQSLARCYQATRRYKAVVVAAAALQTRWRKSLSDRSQQQRWNSALAIQRAWRQSSARRRSNAIYHRVLSTAAVVIQALWKSSRERQKFRIMQSHATAAQARWRSHVARQCFLIRRNQVCLLQSLVRRYLARKKYNAVVSATALIQRIWRKARSNHSANEQCNSAFAIQRAWRLSRERRQLDATCRIQRFWRHKVASTAVVKMQAWWRSIRVRRKYEVFGFHTVAIQRIWRGWTSRRIYLRYKASVTLMQSCWRQHFAKQRFKTVLKLVSRLQRLSRQYLSRKKSHEKLLKAAQSLIHKWRLATIINRRRQNEAARVIQTIWRSFAVRRMYNVAMISLSRIMAWWRHVIRRKRISVTIRCAVMIQRMARGFLLRRHLKISYHAATLIQRFWRGNRLRRHIQINHRAALSLQTSWRLSKARRMYLSTRCLTCKLQALWRQYSARMRFLAVICGLVKLQSLARTFVACLQFRLLVRTAMTVQMWWKTLRLRRLYLLQRACAMTIQARIRGMLERNAHADKVSRLTKIQSLVRGSMVRKLWLSRMGAASKIQKCWLEYKISIAKMRDASLILKAAIIRYSIRRRELKRFVAASKIQAKFRQHSAVIVRRRLVTKVQALARMKRWRCFYFKVLQRIVRTQALARGFCCRIRLQTKHQAATVIQGLWQSKVGRRAFLFVRLCTVMIQSCVRGYFVRKAALKLSQMKKAASTIQRLVSSAMSRKKHQNSTAATMAIQAVIRAFLSRTQFLNKRRSVICLQRFGRRVILEGRLRSQEYQATRLQALVRGSRARREIQVRHESATMIQRCWDSKVCRLRFKRTLLSVIIIQASYRGRVARKLRDAVVLHLNECAYLVQHTWRGKRCRAWYRRLRVGATVIQSFLRGWQARTQFIRYTSSVLVMQKWIRGFSSRMRLKKQQDAAKDLQRYWRGAVVRSRRKKIPGGDRVSAECDDLCIPEDCALLLQKWAHSCLIRKHHNRRRAATVVVQAAARAFLSRSRFLNNRRSVICLQRFGRRVILERRLRSHAYLATRLQAWVRGSRARRDIQERHHSAILIKRRWEASIWRLRFKHTLLSVVTIQASYRGHVARKLRVSLTLHLNECACFVQRSWRGSRCRAMYRRMQAGATVIQSFLRGWQARTQLIRYTSSVLLMQKLIRGFLSRTRLKRLKDAAKNLQRCWRGTAVRSRRKKIASGDGLTAESVGRLVPEVCARLLQKWARSWLIRKYNNRRRAAGVVLQAAIRSFISRSRFVNNRRSVICLQRFGRRVISERFIRIQEYQATRLQAWVRGSRTRRKIRERHQSAIFIQKRYEAKIRSFSFKPTFQFVIAIQALYRGHVARKIRVLLVRRLNECAMVLQCSWHGSRWRALYRWTRAGITVIQSFLRGRLERIKFVKCRWAACLLQSLFRTRYRSFCCNGHGHDQRSQISGPRSGPEIRTQDKVETSHEEFPISFNQSRDDHEMEISTSYLSMKRSKTAELSFRAMQSAARTIQIAYFTWKMELVLLKVQSSVVLLRRSVRGQLVRSARRFALSHMASSFQSNVLASFIRIVTVSDADKISIRCAWEQAVCMAESSACIVVQSAARRMLSKMRSARKRCGGSYEDAVDPLGANFDPLSGAPIVASNDCFELKNFSQNRGCKPQLDLTAITLQRAFRGACARKRVLRLRHNLLVMQSFFRTRIACIRAKKVKFAITVQKLVRRWLAIRTTRKLISLNIPAEESPRISSCRPEFNSVEAAASVLQRSVRTFISFRELRRQRKAAIVLQTFFRSVLKKVKAAQLRTQRRELQELSEQHVHGRALATAEENLTILLGTSLLATSTSICMKRLCKQVRKCELNAIATNTFQRHGGMTGFPNQVIHNGAQQVSVASLFNCEDDKESPPKIPSNIYTDNSKFPALHHESKLQARARYGMTGTTGGFGNQDSVGAINQLHDSTALLSPIKPTFEWD